ncbi:MAG: MerC family mercury resistance protein, partial [Gammaproteobacteria bacterium]
NALGGFAHRQWHRSLLGMAGPALLLLSLYPWFRYGWSSYVTYAALALMVAVSVWDLVSPAHRRCDEARCDRIST